MQILVVDDELSMREYLEVLLLKDGHEVHLAASAREGVEALAARSSDLVITDMKLGSDTGMTVLKAARALSNPPEVIVITAYASPASAVEAMREGAYDYICKPFDNEELKLLVQKALEKRELLRENRALKNSIHTLAGTFLLGNGLAMRRVWEMIEKVAVSRSTVLIAGESGTGKELVARNIHRLGPRALQPFLPVNCAAIAESLLESELFGHVKGAFTGANVDRNGILVSAGEGTVFLDEIGDISAATQVKLLRVLQERRVKPVGSTREVPFGARVLCATNRKLEADVRSGRFREDLFYRLNVIAIELPPLRDRAEDVPLLANHFLSKVAEELGKTKLRFSEEALSFLKAYSFPGNVRQLQNIVERAATLAEGEVLGPTMLPAGLTGQPETAAGQPEAPIPPKFSLERHLDESERRFLLGALKAAGGVKTKAAELLGLSFRSFRYRLAKHGLGELEEPGN